MGWTGDIQVFSPTACFLYDCAGFLQSWLADLILEQQERGVVPLVVPTVMAETNPPMAAWGDAAVVVPWVLYQRYGDVSILAEQFASMRAWVDLLAKMAGERHLWDQGSQIGDWLDPNAPPDNPADARTSPHIVATAYFAHSADLVAQAASVLGHTEEEAHYRALAAKVRAAFAREYITPAGRLLSDATTAYALALEFGLLPDQAQRQHAAERLVGVMRESGYHISTGFVGTPLICDALCHTGNYRAAFRLILQRENPSWLYPVTMGATTIWERWDSLLPDGSVNPGEMTSFNHYALGAVADWMHRTIGGLAPATPGYRNIEVCPRPGGGITQAAVRHQTPYGMAECSWSIEAGQFQMTIVLPPNTTARVTLPGSDAVPPEVGSGTHRWSYAYQDPEARPPLTIDSTVGELIDDAEAWAVVMNAIADLARRAPFVRRMIQGQPHTPLRQVLAGIPNPGEVYSAIESALAGLGR